MTDLPASITRPDILPVSDLLDSVIAGEMRVPRFQRPYVWTPEDMLQLFDSVLRGYPIGSLLIWQTDRLDITSLDRIGPITLPETGPQLKSYVVDGHQRLATLLGVLRLPENHPREKLDDWRWWIAYDLRLEQFVHIRDRAPVIPLTLLPLRSVLRTVDFARRTREIAGSPEFSDSESEQLLDRADNVQKKIREYRVPMTVMRSGNLDDAVTIFARVNQRGRDMTPDQMVSALTFRDRSEGDFDLAASIDDILGSLREVGFGDLQRRIVLQIILAVAGLDFTRPSYERIVSRDSYSKMRPAVDQAESALKQSVRFLNDIVQLKTSRLLPYASIIVMLSIYFHERSQPNSEMADLDDHRENLTHWFWGTSFNGWFAGANTTELRRAGDLMRSLAKNEQGAKDSFVKFFDRPIRPFPETYDRRSARVRASLLVQTIVGEPKNPRTFEPIDVSAIFADVAARDIPYFFPNQRRPAVSNPANRVILPEGFPRSARQDFLQIPMGPDRDRVLRSHFVSNDALAALQKDDFEKFIDYREQSILDAEEVFLTSQGLGIDPAAERNREEIDADDE